MALVSIVIPTYNRKRELLRTLKSAMNQSHKKVEIIIVNDNALDIDLLNDVKEIGDDRIKYFFNERTKGANGARNTGALKSTGEYIAFFDDDDEFLPDYVKNKLDLLEHAADKYGLCLSNYHLEKGKNWKKSNLSKENTGFSDLFNGNLDFGSSSNIFIKRNVIESIGLWDEELLRQQDLEYMVRIMYNFSVVLDKNYTLKVYGHNEPDPLKAFDQRELYQKKIEKYVSKLEPIERKSYYSIHFRRQANYLMKLKEYRSAFEYWQKGIENKTFALKKDVKIILSGLKNVIH